MAEEIVNIDPVPDLTPERLAENAEFQAEMKQRFAVRPPKNHAEMVIADNLRVIEMLERQRLSGRDDLDSRIDKLRNDTALWMQSVGMFTEAAKIAVKPRIKAENETLLAALERDDDEWCGHAKWKEVADKKVPNYSREFDFTDKIGRRLSMIQCAECGFRNGRELPQDLENLSRRRAHIREAISKHGLKGLDEVKKAGLATDLAQLANG